MHMCIYMSVQAGKSVIENVHTQVCICVSEKCM